MEISLALGGGGSKGYAHLGVLKALEKEGFTIRAVAGTSMGGVIGSSYAVGYPTEEIESILAELDQDTLYERHADEGPAYLGLFGVSQALEQALQDKTFEDLILPFSVTAVDMHSAELLAIRSGRLQDAVLATIAVPGIFPPKIWNGRTLIDGGILDPVPVALARQLAPNLPVVAVVLSPPYRNWVRRPQPRLLSSLPLLGKVLSHLRWTQAINIFLGAVDISSALLTDLRLEIDKPEVIIRPQVHHIGLVDPVDIREVARLGEQAVEAALPELMQTATFSRLLARRLRGWFPRPESDRYVS